MNETQHFTLEKDGSNDHCQLDNRVRGNQVMFDYCYDAAPTAFGVRPLARQVAVSPAD